MHDAYEAVTRLAATRGIGGNIAELAPVFITRVI